MGLFLRFVLITTAKLATKGAIGFAGGGPVGAGMAVAAALTTMHAKSLIALWAM